MIKSRLYAGLIRTVIESAPDRENQFQPALSLSPKNFIIVLINQLRCNFGPTAQVIVLVNRMQRKHLVECPDESPAGKFIGLFCPDYCVAQQQKKLESQKGQIYKISPTVQSEQSLFLSFCLQKRERDLHNYVTFYNVQSKIKQPL